MAEPLIPKESVLRLILGAIVTVITSPWRALRWFGRGVRRRARVLLYILIVLVAVHLVATLITGLMLKRELASLRASGFILNASQLAPKVPPGKPNAADTYQKAFDARRVSNEDDAKLAYGKSGAEWSPEQAALVGRVVSDNRGYLRLIEEASRTPDCAFPVKWNAGPGEMVFTHFAKMRDAVRMLGLRAGLKSRDGKIDAALADCAAMLRIADHMTAEPTLIGQLVAYAVEGMAVKSVQYALSAGDPSPAAARQLMDQIAAVELIAPSIRSMKGEISLFGLPVFDMMRHGRAGEVAAMTGDGTSDQWRGRLFRVFGTIGWPLANLDEITYLRIMKAQVDGFALPWPASNTTFESLTKRTESTPIYRGLLTRMITPVFSRAAWSREKTAANLGDARIALALTIYKSQRGAYPDSLAQLEQAGFKLPVDPFGGKPFRYRREGAGFMVYSVGADMVDQGGLPPAWDLRSPLSPKDMELRKDHYDLPFTRTR